MSDNLYQRNDIWWIKIQVAGQVHRRSLRTRSRSVAKKLAAELRTQLSEHAVTGKQRHTYAEAAKKWARETLPSIEPSTARRYLSSARSFGPAFRALFLDQIKPETIAAFVSERKQAGASDPTIRRDLTALSSLLKSAMSWGWTSANAAKTWDRSLLKESSPEVARIDQASFDAVAKEAPPTLAALMHFLLATGMRLEEATSLTWRHYDKAGGTVYLAKTKTHDPRTIELEPDAIRILSRLPVTLGSPYVFTHAAGHRYSSPSSLFGKVRERTQKAAQEDKRHFQTFRLHDLRHEFAARWLKRGGSIYDLSRYLGHKSVATTERHYLRFIPTGKVEIARRREGTIQDTGKSGPTRAKPPKTA